MPSETYSDRDRLINALLLLGMVICGCLWFIASFSRTALPYNENIDPQLLNAPRQTPTERGEFLFNYRGKVYDVAPVAEYELFGLVVSHNNINSIADIYHDDDSVDLKDICVIWGDNVRKNDFREVSFKSNSWTCSYSYFEGIEFHHDQISNNHLLAADPGVQKTIRKFKIGDQVRLKGMLTDYRPAGSEYTRKSSTTRTDTGNGACEVMFVESAEIVATTFPLWEKVFVISKWGFFFLVFLRITAFLMHLRSEKKAFDAYERTRQERLENRGRFGKI